MSKPQFLASSIDLKSPGFKGLNKQYVTLNEQSSHMIERDHSRSRTGLEVRDPVKMLQ